MKKIGVLRLSALGDVVLAVPLVNALLRAYPEAEVTWVTTQPTVDLIGPMKRVKWVIVSKPKSFRAFWDNHKALRGMHLDTLLLLQASLSAHLVSMQISAERKIGFDRRRGKDFHQFFIDESIPYENQHFVDAFLDFARKIDVCIDEASWQGAFSNMDSNWARRTLPEGTPRIGISTTPSKIERRWSEDGYEEVIERLLSKNRLVCLLGGDGEEEVSFNAELASHFSDKILNLTGKTNLSQLSALLKEIDLLVAPDTGCVHLARALGTPVVGLYAVANPSLTGPYQAQDYCVNKFHEAVQKYLPLKKGQDYHLRVHHPDAMTLIKPKEVTEMIDEALAAFSH
jgi:heptosyltransferase I